MAAVFLVTNMLKGQVLSALINQNKGLSINVRSMGLPIGAGLGSSAAFSVALSGALLRYKQLFVEQNNGCALSTLPEWTYDLSKEFAVNPSASPFIIPSQQNLEVINKWAYSSEIVIHGTPSGLDNTTSCFGGYIKFSKRPGSRFESLTALPTLNILLTNTLVPRRTADLVAKVGRLYEKHPEIVKPIFDSIEAISQRFLMLCSNQTTTTAVDIELVSGTYTFISHIMD